MNILKKFTLLLLFSVIGFAFSQAQGLSVVTGHPDFKIKITRCEAAGKTVVVDMTWENISPQDIRMSIYAGWPNMTYAYDDEGNKFAGNDIKVRVANGELKGLYENELFPSEVPLKVRLQIENVPVSATEFKKIYLGVDCRTWNLEPNKPVIIKNLPISRDGD